MNCSVIVLLFALAGGEGPRPETRPYLGMASDRPPARLSQTGTFADVRSLRPIPSLIPYDLIVPFWSDGASKCRWVAIPSGRSIRVLDDGSWRFPAGTVFVKHFEIGEEPSRRLETRLLAVDPGGRSAGGRIDGGATGPTPTSSRRPLPRRSNSPRPTLRSGNDGGSPGPTIAGNATRRPRAGSSGPAPSN